MFKNYFKTAWRNIRRNSISSVINISGLAVGMAVAMLISLWIRDELSFNKYHKQYDRIAQVMQQETHSGTVYTDATIPLPLDAELRKNYGNDFKHIVMVSWTENHILMAGDKIISYPGNFMGAEGPDLFTLQMLKGDRKALTGPSSMLISATVAKAIFGDEDPMGKLIMIDHRTSFKVGGVYEDLPVSSSLHELAFIAPWDFYVHAKDWIGRDDTKWDDNSLFMYVQIADQADMSRIAEKIKNIKLNRVSAGEAKLKPVVFLQPMSKWHLYSEFKNGVNTGGAIQFVWLFGIIGLFVLLLACINFMNLSTARSERRAKEVGIRKSIGSLRQQLIVQFYCESLLVATCAFVLAILLVWLGMPFFNELANKNISIPWDNPFFWISCMGFTLLTGLIAGSYPALYLSSFRPVKVLKGTFKAGRLASIPRKALVVVQFTVSVILIICTIIVYKQIQFAKNRPVGYSRDGLVDIQVSTDDLDKHFNVVRDELQHSGAIAEMAESTSPTTGINNNRNDLDWKGKDPATTLDFGNIKITTGYGQTVGWQFTEGRDFSSRLISDSFSLVLNEAAVKMMDLKHPVGEIVRVGRRDLTIIGVVKDMVMASPYEPARPTIFSLGNHSFDDIIIRINPKSATREALKKIEAVCKIYSPSVPFSYRFADEEYAKKFSQEERIATLSSFFATLAIFISCLGLFGMATFTAEQRIKEIGVRKVLGASVFDIWSQLSRDFVLMVILSILIASPVAHYLMSNWLQRYDYRSDMPWWAFALAGAGAIFITLLTISYQGIKAALKNPVNSLRAE